MNDKEVIIKSFIKNFVQKDRTERALFELTSSKNRRKFANRMNHQWEQLFIMKYLKQVEKIDDYPEKIKNLLQIKKGDICYIISNYSQYDDALLPFEVAFDALYSAGFASVLVNANADTILLITEQVKGPAPKFIGRQL